jgi:hypothetical protein
MSKYLKTKNGSIESAVLTSVVTPKEEPKVERKEYKPATYLGHRKGSLADAIVQSVNEGLSAGQKKLPPALQKAILAKQGKKKDEAATHKMPDGTIMKGAKHKDEVKEDLGKEDDTVVKDVIGQLKKAVKAHASQAKDLDKAMKNEKLEGGQKKLDKDKDGDLDAKDFAMLRKSKNEEDAYDKDDEKPKPKPKKEDVSDMNKKKHAAYKDPKRGEHDVVDPKPVMKQTKEMWSKAGDDLEETQSKAKYMKTPSQDTDGEMPPVEKKKPMKASYKMMRDQMKKADTGSKETKVDTDPSIDYKH